MTKFTSTRPNLIAGASLLAVISATSPAFAQSPLQAPPPTNFSVDERGVDLVSGTYNLATTDVVIGQPGAGGLSYSRAYVGPGWRDSITGTLDETPAGYFVSVGGASEQFTLTGGVFVPKENVGATLVTDGSGGHIFTTADGVIYRFSPPSGSYNSPTDADRGSLASITYPSGEVVTLNYRGQRSPRAIRTTRWCRH